MSKIQSSKHDVIQRVNNRLGFRQPSFWHGTLDRILNNTTNQLASTINWWAQTTRRLRIAKIFHKTRKENILQFGGSGEWIRQTN